MITAALFLVLSQAPGSSASRVTRVERLPGNRAPGGRIGAKSFAQYEVANAQGIGMPAVCSCAAITSATGTAVNVTRATNAVCTKGVNGLRSTGISDGDLVVCSSNQGRVELTAAGQAGLRIENSKTNTIPDSAEICAASWADVGTPACTANTTSGPFGTTTMDTLTDNDGVAFEGRSVAITTTSASRHSVGCYVKSISGATAASITLVGTGSATGDCTGTSTTLSTTQSTRVSCTSPAAYAGTLTAVTVTIRFGTVVGDQGSIAVEGCDHQVGSPVLMSHIPTSGGAATRNHDAIASAGTWASVPGSMGVNVEGLETFSTLAGGRYPLSVYTNVSNFTGVQTFGTVIANTSVSSYTSALTPAATSARLASAYDGTNYFACLNSTCTSSALSSAGINTTQPSVSPGSGGLVANGSIDGIYTNICVDPSTTRCR